MIQRGGVHWADLGEAQGSRPAKRRPVVIVSSDDYNRTSLQTVVALAITSNTSLAAIPGNVFLAAASSGLPKDSVVNVTAVVTLDKDDLREPVGLLPLAELREIETGLRRSLSL